MRTILVNISFAVVTFVGANGFAQPAPVAAPTKSPPTNPTDKPAPTKPSRASVSRIAEALAAEIAHVQGRVFVAAAPLVSKDPAPRAAELAVLVATQLAGRHGASARAHGKPVSLADARIEARSSDALVMLQVEIVAGKMRVVADVFPVPRTVWARVRDPEPGPVAHAFAEAPLDAEVRTYLAPVTLTQLDVVRGQNFEGDVVAVACADIDADGATEIITVSRRRVTAVRLRDGKVVPLQSRTWADLSTFAPTPLREPIASVGVVERSDDAVVLLDVGLSDRTKAVRLDGQLGVVATLAGLPVGSGEASSCVRLSPPWLTGPLLPCIPGETPLRPSLTGTYDAIASASLVSAQGEPFVVFAARNERGVVEVRDDAGHATTIDGAGAQLAVGDLDQDGEPEILGSLDVAPGSTDAVVVRSWMHRGTESARPKETFRLPAAAGVRALTVCPPDGLGRAPFVVATADEIWVAR